MVAYAMRPGPSPCAASIADAASPSLVCVDSLNRLCLAVQMAGSGLGSLEATKHWLWAFGGDEQTSGEPAAAPPSPTPTAAQQWRLLHAALTFTSAFTRCTKATSCSSPPIQRPARQGAAETAGPENWSPPAAHAPGACAADQREWTEDAVWRSSRRLDFGAVPSAASASPSAAPCISRPVEDDAWLADHISAAPDSPWTLPPLDGCCVPAAAKASLGAAESLACGGYMPPPPLSPEGGAPRSALRRAGTPSRHAGPARRISFSFDQVKVFETVPGQEFWHNDVSCMYGCYQEQCDCDGVDGVHATYCPAGI